MVNFYYNKFSFPDLSVVPTLHKKDGEVGSVTTQMVNMPCKNNFLYILIILLPIFLFKMAETIK